MTRPGILFKIRDLLNLQKSFSKKTCLNLKVSLPEMFSDNNLSCFELLRFYLTCLLFDKNQKH